MFYVIRTINRTIFSSKQSLDPNKKNRASQQLTHTDHRPLLVRDKHPDRPHRDNRAARYQQQLNLVSVENNRPDICPADRKHYRAWLPDQGADRVA